MPLGEPSLAWRGHCSVCSISQTPSLFVVVLLSDLHVGVQDVVVVEFVVVVVVVVVDAVVHCCCAVSD